MRVRSIRSQYDAYLDSAQRDAITVTSYRMLANLPEMSTEWRWGTVILDEAHEKLRTPVTRTFQRDTQPYCVQKLLENQCDRAVVLTGTPAVSKALDVFAIADALVKGNETFGSGGGGGTRKLSWAQRRGRRKCGGDVARRSRKRCESACCLAGLFSAHHSQRA